MNPLRQRMIEDMQVRHLAPKTHLSYQQLKPHFNLQRGAPSPN